MADTSTVLDTSGTSSEVGEPMKRERSSIEFPYTDLNDALAIANGVHSLGGSCEWNTLAGQLKATPDGGGFRSRMSAARMFGLLKWEKATVQLTDLGARACDPQQEKAARVEAFLTVPLYSKVYEQFNGKTLPPVSGLETFMGNLGVAAKQKERARQAFQRSAKQAGFFDFGSERLVKPPTGKPFLQTPPSDPKSNPPGLRKADGGEQHAYDPLIEGLLKRLPSPESAWPIDARKRWLQAASNIFDVMYTDPEGDGEVVIELKRVEK